MRTLVTALAILVALVVIPVVIGYWIRTPDDDEIEEPVRVVINPKYRSLFDKPDRP